MIRRRLIRILVLFATVPMLGVGVLGYLYARDALERMRVEEMKRIADLKAEKIELFFEERRSDIAAVTRYAFLKEALRTLDGYGGGFESPAQHEAKVTLDRFLLPIQNVNEYEEILLLDPEGNIVYTSKEERASRHAGSFLPVPYNHAFDMVSDEISTSDVYENSEEDSRFRMLMTAPVRDDGTILGRIAFELDMEPIFRFIQDTSGLGATGETLIAKNIGGAALFLNTLRHDPYSALRRKAVFGDRQAIPIQEALQGRDGLGLSIDYRGERVLAAWRYLPTLGWGMVAKVDAAEAFAPVAKLRKIISLFTLVMLISGVAVAASISNSITEPIRRLHHGTERIGEGDLNHKVGTLADDEIGQLSRAFDEMTENLKGVTASRDELDREVHERRRAEGALERTVQELKEKNEELERFAYMVSHDLKSPLITIQGFLGLVEKDMVAGDSDRVRADLERISAAAKKMKRLLDDLLELSRIGRLVLRPEAIPLSQLAREAVSLVEGRISEGQVKVQIDDDLPVVFGDPPRLLEMLQNLVDNAAKFIGQRADPLVEIGARTEGNGTLYFVRDNGIGIDPRYHGRVFEIFDTLDPDAEGSGIGLALVKKIVDMHGGCIWIESEGNGMGATFCFTIPTEGEAPDGVRDESRRLPD